MNKINNKGFMMAEIIVVAVVIVIALVGLFTTFTRTFIEYERLNEYSQVDSLYASKSVINTLYSDIDSAKKALEDESVNFKEYTVTTNIELEPLFNKYKIITFYLVKYSDEGFNSLISSLTNNEELKRYVNYLKNNLNLTDGSCEVISILEMQFDSSSNKNQFGYYKFVKTTTGGGAGGGGVSEPDLTTGLIPVVYDDSGSKTKWFVADTSEIWYDYESQWWANAVAVDSSTPEKREKYVKDGEYLTKDSSGNPNEIAQEDLLAMFVWIPRYSYTIGCLNSDTECYGYRMNNDSDKDWGNPSKTNPGAIDIKFISKDTSEDELTTKDIYPTYKFTSNETRESEIDNWYTHPAFDFGGKRLSGLWVGKFETSVVTTSSCYNTYLSNCSVGEKEVRILPNVVPIRRQKVANQFNFSQYFANNELYGLTEYGDSHMMKNIEWSAVAYLSQSKYGKYGSVDYKNRNKEIYKNPSIIGTGYSTGAIPSSSSLSSSVSYNKDVPNRVEGTGKIGAGASTTGNIYGVYDMSGGALETVMIKYDNNVSSSDIDFSKIDSKYYDVITTEISSTTPFANKTKETVGQAFYEVAGWYDDRTDTLSTSYAWFTRGGEYNGDKETGPFGGYTYSGVAGSSYSFRVSFVNAQS